MLRLSANYPSFSKQAAKNRQGRKNFISARRTTPLWIYSFCRVYCSPGSSILSVSRYKAWRESRVYCSPCCKGKNLIREYRNTESEVNRWTKEDEGCRRNICIIHARFSNIAICSSALKSPRQWQKAVQNIEFRLWRPFGFAVTLAHESV